ncbi:MAG: hypothetical protein P4L67_04035 [Candidatus Pacebacteria bacterium]|nr:hypothetical protein [Candidatus Paceibacterota bacterium]
MSKHKIEKVGILKLSKMLLVMSDGKVTVMKPTMEEKTVLVKSGATTFAINEMDRVAIAVGKRVLFFYFELSTANFAPLNLSKSNEIALPEQVAKLGTSPVRYVHS